MFALLVLPWKNSQINGGASRLNLTRLTLALYLAGTAFLGCVRRLQMAAQSHVQRDRNAHHDQRTHTQNQEPPDHPHSRLE
jgi:ABC-type nickel/cobalt efflux system permease component RcnA